MARRAFRGTIERYWVPALVLAMLATLAGCGSSTGAASSAGAPAAGLPAPEVASIKVAGVREAATYAALYIAQGKDYFKHFGLTVDIQNVEGTAAHYAALNSGSVDLDIDDPFSAYVAASAGAPFKIVAALGQANAFAFVISKKYAAEHGLTSSTPPVEAVRALRGARIAVSPPGGSVNMIAVAGLKAAGLDPGTDVRLSTVGSGAAMAAGLEQGSFDAFLYVPPVTTTAQDRNGALVVPVTGLGAPFADRSGYNFSVLTTDKFVTKNPKTTVAFVAAYQCARKYSLAHIQEAFAVLQKFAPSVDLASFKATVASYGSDPVPAQDSNAGILQVINQAQPAGAPAYNLTFDKIADPSIATQAAALPCPA